MPILRKPAGLSNAARSGSLQGIPCIGCDSARPTGPQPHWYGRTIEIGLDQNGQQTLGWAVRGALCNHCRCVLARDGHKLSAIHSLTPEERAQVKRKSLIKRAETNFITVSRVRAMKTKKKLKKDSQGGKDGGVVRVLKKAATI